jgi:F5/8 type C domain
VSSPLAGSFYFAERSVDSPKPSEEGSGKGQAAQPNSQDAIELAFWSSIQNSDDRAVYETYLQQFPNGTFAALAHIKIKEIEKRENAETARAAADKKAADEAAAQDRNRFARLSQPNTIEREPERPQSAGEDCTRSAGVLYCASSVLPPEKGNSYGIRNLTDGSDNTAWVSSQGIGEWIVFEFDKPRLIRGLTIRNDYAKNDDIYRKNSRVKDVELTFSNGESLKATLEDRADEQHVTLKKPAVAKWVQLTIRSVYSGWKYSDTAINEVRVDGN